MISAKSYVAMAYQKLNIYQLKGFETRKMFFPHFRAWHLWNESRFSFKIKRRWFSFPYCSKQFQLKSR